MQSTISTVLIAELLEPLAEEKWVIVTSDRPAHAKNSKPSLELLDCVLCIRALAHLLVHWHAEEVVHQE